MEKRILHLKFLYNALDNISAKIDEEESLSIFEKSLENVMPHVEVRSRRIGGALFSDTTSC